MSVLDQIKKFENTSPEIVFEWNDLHTDARGWMVINSLRGGAAGGGTRMRKGLDKKEVISLAKTMEIKFSVSGPPIGGAKSGIDFDPNDPRKNEVLHRWYKALIPILKSYYGTGGDLNVDEIHDVIPITEQYGLWHPQEGVVNGHFGSVESDKIKRIGQLRQGVSKIIEDIEFSPDLSRKYKIADMITGYGVAASVISYYQLTGQSVQGKKVLVQGWGNVGSAAAYFLAQQGAKVVGIIDRAGGIINHTGLSFEQVKELFLNKKNNALHTSNILSFEKVNSEIWDISADVFLPCAASRLVEAPQIERLLKNGLQMVSCGANVPFADPEIFFGNTTGIVDERCVLIPDFVANCGMARVFAYLMSSTQVEISDQAIFQDVKSIIEKFIQKALNMNNSNTHFTKTCFELAFAELMK